MGREAIDALRTNLEGKQAGELGRKVLVDIGVVPSARERDVLLSGDSESGNLLLDILKKLAESNAEADQNAESNAEADRDGETDVTP